MSEDWKVIENTDGGYWISNLGEVYSNKGKIDGVFMRLHRNKLGYMKVGIITEDNRILFSVHRLVAKAFVPGYREGLVVNHIDGVRHNNHYKNLEWVTQAENVCHGFKLKLNRKNP